MWDNCCRRSGSASDLSRDTTDAYSPINRSDSPLAQVRIIPNPLKINYYKVYNIVLFIIYYCYVTTREITIKPCKNVFSVVGFLIINTSHIFYE